MDIVPFDDTSRLQVKDQLSKLNGKEESKEFLTKLLSDVYSSREKALSEPIAREVEKFAYLKSLDDKWIEYIDQIDGLKQGVGLRGRNDDERIGIFKTEAFDMFSGLLDTIDSELSKRLFRIQVAHQAPTIPLAQARTNVDTKDGAGLISESADDVAKKGAPAFASTSTFGAGSSSSITDNRKSTAKLGRNDPCWCGSGKKFKKCHYPQMP